MLNEIEWVGLSPEFDQSYFEDSGRGWTDLQLVPGIKPVDLDRAISRRTYLTSEYFSRIRTATVVVLTLGLNEVWRDSRTGRRLNSAPSFSSVRRDPERYALELSDVAANLESLQAIHRHLVAFNPHVRVIVTVSPVPMGETFSGRDVLIANTVSKATLRVAAEAFANSHSSVDYFPSFDMIAAAQRSSAYMADCLHVEDETVEKVVQQFLQLYLDRTVDRIDFHETSYLRANPDVEAAVRRGELSSGFEHWRAFGEAEGRALKPVSG